MIHEFAIREFAIILVIMIDEFAIHEFAIQAARAVRKKPKAGNLMFGGGGGYIIFGRLYV